MAKEVDKEQLQTYENSLKYWRSWGSWFSWGSPVGLGLFFIAVAFTVWLLGQTFNW
ncbi:MAG TPA: hypothetical protein VFH39_00280 [Candidatus Saccharimonadales bacterium]|nr:hypothetical protein [Candidatus Saccharimonadales bacterium]